MQKTTYSQSNHNMRKGLPGMKIKSAEILCVGTEILIGDIINTNAAYIAGKLALLGINHYYQAVVGDNPKRLSSAINAALERCDLLIMSGGLGPTCDDLTKETVAECMHRKLVFNSEAYENIEKRFAAQKRTLTDNNKKQAYIPEGSVVFQNTAGTAPGCAVEDPERGKTVIMLPGPPFEMKKMFEVSVIPYLSAFTDRHFESKNLNIYGLGESAVEDILRDLMNTSENPTVAPYCGDGEVRLRITAGAENHDKCALLIDRKIEEIRKTPVAPFIYGVDTNLETALVKKFSQAGKTIATAESCTGGLIAKRITDVPGSSAVLTLGAVTYTVAAKEKVLSVPSEIIERYGVVSEQTAIAMAKGARLLSGADVAVSTTGIAGPGGGTKETPVGTVFVGVSTAKEDSAVKLSLLGDRDRVRLLASSSAISLAVKTLPAFPTF